MPLIIKDNLLRLFDLERTKLPLHFLISSRLDAIIHIDILSIIDFTSEGFQNVQNLGSRLNFDVNFAVKYYAKLTFVATQQH